MEHAAIQWMPNETTTVDYFQLSCFVCENTKRLNILGYIFYDIVLRSLFRVLFTVSNVLIITFSSLILSGFARTMFAVTACNICHFHTSSRFEFERFTEFSHVNIHTVWITLSSTTKWSDEAFDANSSPFLYRMLNNLHEFWRLVVWMECSYGCMWKCLVHPL